MLDLSLDMGSATWLGGGGIQVGGDSGEFQDGITAQHWRIRSRRNNGSGGGYTTLSEIVWLDGSGNPVSTVGATASGTALQAGTHAELYDGNTSTFAQVPTNTNCYFAMQFPSPVEVTGVKLTPYSTFTDRVPRSFDVEYSNVGGSNDSDWTLFMSVYQPSWASSTQQTFMRPTRTVHQYWRILPSSLGGGLTLAFSELQFREETGTPQIPSGGSAIYFSQQTSFPASNLFDNNTSTLYAENDSSFLDRASYVGYQFPSPVGITQVAMTARSDGFADQSPTAGTVQSGVDGISWRPRKTFSGLSYTLGSTNTINL